MPDTIIYKSRIQVGDRLFKPVLEKRLPGQLGGVSGIAGGLHEFWAALDRRNATFPGQAQEERPQLNSEVGRGDAVGRAWKAEITLANTRR